MFTLLLATSLWVINHGRSAAKLEGFPRQPSDAHEIQFGVFGPRWAGGAISMPSTAKMLLAMALVEARIESDYSGAHTAQSALLFASIGATAVDTFVTELRCFETNCAVLHCSELLVQRSWAISPQHLEQSFSATC